MAEPLRSYGATEPERRRSEIRAVGPASDRGPAHQAYRLLHVGFVAAPLIAGMDKFFNALANWEAYLAPVFPSLLGVLPRTFMYGVGVIEIIAGIGVAFKPKVFGYVVAGWLGGIIINLLLRGEYYDIALRDFGLMLGALALARLASVYDRKSGPRRLGT